MLAIITMSLSGVKLFDQITLNRSSSFEFLDWERISLVNSDIFWSKFFVNFLFYSTKNGLKLIVSKFNYFSSILDELLGSTILFTKNN